MSETLVDDPSVEEEQEMLDPEEPPSRGLDPLLENGDFMVNQGRYCVKELPLDEAFVFLRMVNQIAGWGLYETGTMLGDLAKNGNLGEDSQSIMYYLTPLMGLPQIKPMLFEWYARNIAEVVFDEEGRRIERDLTLADFQDKRRFRLPHFWPLLEGVCRNQDVEGFFTSSMDTLPRLPLVAWVNQQAAEIRKKQELEAARARARELQRIGRQTESLQNSSAGPES